MRLLLGGLLVAFSTACGGAEGQFIGSRILDACDGEWPICATTAGCILGDRSYVQGRFPGANKVVIPIFEPSEVTVSVFLSETSGAGQQTVVNLYEPACASRTRVTMTGTAFVAEAQQNGLVTRKADLSGVGDHLIEVESDARSKYLLKVDVLPLRLRE